MLDHLPMFQRDGKSAFKKDLHNIKALCQQLGNPERSLRCIHIAGTNGKGSVSHLIAAMLQTHGFKTGLYTSPHYKDFRERIKINGAYIPKKRVTRFVKLNRSLFDQIQPSFFEMSFAMALDYFKEEQVDYAVIETGLGGRLDSTNIIKPLLSVITNISWDHTDLLGDSLEKIAEEKAGIIKSGVPVLIGRRQAETQTVFDQHSRAKKSPLSYAGDVDLTELGLRKNGSLAFSASLSGPYQTENILTAMASFCLFCQEAKIKISAENVKLALQNTQTLTRMMGRWHFVKAEYDLLMDSAHNEDGIRHFANWLEQQSYSKVHIVCGFVKDKSIDTLLNLLPKTAIYYFTQASIPRALDAKALKKQGKSNGLIGKSFKKVRNALASAKRLAKTSELVVVIGSIFVVGEVIE